ncbi:MAG: metallophosphoesterase [Lachnospiraceae bacterium]|nr:metallophosphoesterase [Lachnospiraceae bacterium]
MKTARCCADLEPRKGRDKTVVITKYTIYRNIKNHTQADRLRIALVADLHNRPYKAVINGIRKAAPDIIAAAGDLVLGTENEVTDLSMQKNALDFLSEASTIAPTFYSLGNHERFTGDDGFGNRYSFIDIMPIVKTGAILLDDAALQWKGINIGGLSSASVHMPVPERGETPNLAWLEEFDRLKGFKILLCHQPEYYPKYVRKTSADIVLSGHAHGGQWRFFGHGVYAPGQGMFPQLTSGVHEDRLVISRGLSNTVKIPRFFNPTELVIVDLV